MEKLLVLLILAVLVLVAGCGELTEGQRAYWANIFQNFEPGTVNPGYIQALPCVSPVPGRGWQQNNSTYWNSTYWQEANAQRQMYERK